ncbi:hypothetical protein BH23CHL3_BH23CHL3_01330 [soil metagenome]
MPSMIDHIVIVDRDLGVLVEQARSVGFTVTPGGEHAGGMTHNALIAFQDGSYIELITFIEPEKRSTHRWWSRLWKGGGLTDFALLCDDLDAEVAAINDRGLVVPEPEGSGRLRPDGERLEWQSSFPQPVVGETGMPFVIEDRTPRSLRVPHADDETTHANGVAGIAGITLLVEDIDSSALALGAITGNPVELVDTNAAGVLAAKRSAVGSQPGHWIVIAQPDVARVDDLNEGGLPAKYLEKYGHGPFSAVLTTGASPGSLAPTSGAEIDANLLAGSRLRIA